LKEDIKKAILILEIFGLTINLIFMKIINILLTLCISSGLVYWWATEVREPDQGYEGMNKQMASVQPTSAYNSDRSSPTLDLEETHPLPVASLYRYLPSAYADILNSCNISSALDPQLQSLINKLSTKGFDDDFSSLANDLRTEELKENPDAWAILGLLYEEHLVPEVANTLKSNEIAFELYSDSSKMGSMIGNWLLARAYHYGFPHSRWLESDTDLDDEIFKKLTSQEKWSHSTGFLLKQLYADNLPNEELDAFDREVLLRQALQECDNWSTRATLGNFLISFYGAQSDEGVEGLSLLESVDAPYAQEILGDLYDKGQSIGITNQELIDYEKALGYYIAAARQGDPDSAYKAFYRLVYDNNYPEDDELAREMLNLAARLGNWEAISYKAAYLARGFLGFSKNISLAIHHTAHLAVFQKGDGSITSDELANELEFMIQELLLEEDMSTTSVEAAKTLGENLIQILRELDYSGRIASAERNLETIKTRFEAQSFQDVDFGHYHALVIGNNEYEDLPDLSSPVNDANMIANVLQEDYGFEVTLLLNSTRNEIVSTINSYRNSLKKNDNFLIYYAGHGQIDPDTAQGFWQPTDAKANDDTNWIPNDRITSTLRGFESDNILVIADSCYSGIVIRGPRQLENSENLVNSDYVTSLLRRRTRMALTSGGVEPVIDTLPGTENSIFALALLNTLQENQKVITATDIYRRVSQDVVANLSSIGITQTPEFAGLLRSGHEGGDFFFNRTD